MVNFSENPSYDDEKRIERDLFNLRDIKRKTVHDDVKEEEKKSDKIENTLNLSL